MEKRFFQDTHRKHHHHRHHHHYHDKKSERDGKPISGTSEVMDVDAAGGRKGDSFRATVGSDRRIEKNPKYIRLSSDGCSVTRQHSSKPELQKLQHSVRHATSGKDEHM